MWTTALPTLPISDAHFAEFRCPLCRKKLGKMGKVGTLCRIRQNGFRQAAALSLQPLVDLTLDLQKESANAETAVNVIRYLKSLSSNNQQMSSAIKSVYNKWLDKNEIVIGLLHEHGRFYDYNKSKVTSQSNNSAWTSDHGYAPQMVSYQQFPKQQT